RLIAGAAACGVPAIATPAMAGGPSITPFPRDDRTRRAGASRRRLLAVYRPHGQAVALRMDRCGDHVHRIARRRGDPGDAERAHGAARARPRVVAGADLAGSVDQPRALR